ncbi:MAG: Xaa-Pro peptidase family protein [Bacillota bacterium]
MQVTPLAELKDRVRLLQERLQGESLDGALIMENTDLFYFTGSMQQGFFFVPAEGDPFYLVRRNFERAREESLWGDIFPLAGFRDLPVSLAEHGFNGLKRIGLELDVLPVNNYERILKLFPGVQYADISTLLREIRMVKSDYEIDCFRRAGEVALAVNRQIPALLQVGKAEIHLSAEIENLHRRAGHQGVLRMRAFNAEMYFGHVYSGANGALHTFVDSCTGGSGVATACPQGAGWKTLAPHEPIGVDYAAIYGGYIIDHTRIFSIGELPGDLQKAYAVAVEIQEEVMERALPGASCAELYRLAVEIAAKRGLVEYFMGCGPEQVKFVGHGIGLEIDELPVIGQGSPYTLKEGMVFALEPKFIFPGRGMVGLENTWCVTAHGPENLSPIPEDLVVVPVD